MLNYLLYAFFSAFDILFHAIEFHHGMRHQDFQKVGFHSKSNTASPTFFVFQGYLPIPSHIIQPLESKDIPGF